MTETTNTETPDLRVEKIPTLECEEHGEVGQLNLFITDLYNRSSVRLGPCCGRCVAEKVSNLLGIPLEFQDPEEIERQILEKVQEAENNNSVEEE